MPLFGQCFLSDVLKKPVLDRRGDVAGRLKDILVVKGDFFESLATIVIRGDEGTTPAPTGHAPLLARVR